jgi:hypothetical protein
VVMIFCYLVAPFAQKSGTSPLTKRAIHGYHMRGVVQQGVNVPVQGVVFEELGFILNHISNRFFNIDI